MKEVLGIIPARGGSKGIPHKNMVELCGKPLIQYTFDAVCGSKMLTRCIVSTEDTMIKKYSEEQGFEVIDRPEELATDFTTTASVILYTLDFLKKKENYIPEYVMILQPTSPLRESKDIDECIDLIQKKGASSVVSVMELPHNYLPEKLMVLKHERLFFESKDGIKYTTRQMQRTLYARNGAAIYLFKTSVIYETMSYYGDDCVPYIMPKCKSLDIDDYEDLELIKAWILYCKQ